VSPARGRKKVIPKRRDRREIVVAVLSATAVVVVTVFAIWALRPGPSSRFDGGGGGIFNRQPRASWLVILTIVALAIVLGTAQRGDARWRARRKALLGAGIPAVFVLAVVAGFFWPDGLLRKYRSLPDFNQAVLNATTLPITPTAPGETTAPPTAPGETTTTPTTTIVVPTDAGTTPTTVSTSSVP
jgi:hypothetical protein